MERWLEFLKTITNLKVLVQMLGLTPENEERFWKDLLTLLKSQEHPVVFDDGELTGLIGQVISSADFEDRDTEPFTSELYNTLKELIYNDTNDSFWNESVQQLIKYFIKNIEERPEDKILIPIGDDNEHSIRISDLKAADAGNSFSYTPINDEDYWVRPEYNIDDRAYDEVRGHDALEADLSNDVAVQFTKEKDIETWIRLLMPQYGRRVLVEDLDRNFWVIAQTISAICAYLFGDENPINKMCEGIAREVSEIWENVLYLWLEIAAITQKKQKDIRVMSLYVPPRDNEHGRKYDDFESKNSVMSWDVDEYGNMVITVEDWNSYKNEIVDRIGYLTEDFANQDLCVLPIVRLDNYTVDFYSTEYYPMVLFYSKDTKEWTYKRIKEQIGDTLKDSLIISPRFEDKADGKKRFTDQIMGQYRTCEFDQAVWPFSKVPSQSNGEENPTLKYIGCLRVKPDITLKENETEIENLELSVYDTFAFTPLSHEGELIDRDYSFIGKYSLIPSNDDSLVLTYQANSEQAEQREEYYEDTGVSWQALKAWYGGEVASWMLETASIISSDNLFNNQAYVVKIGNYLPIGGGQFIMASVLDGSDYKYTSMYGNVTRYAGSGSSVLYYRFRWDTYNAEHDGGPEKVIVGNNICYNKEPEKRECTYPTKAHIEYDGLIAAKNFIKANADTVGKNPCFIATTIGLTPWSGGGRGGSNVYWDGSFVPALYFYIPTIESLTGMPEETEGYDFSPYIKAYTENEAIYLTNDSLNADERPDGDGTIYIEKDGQKKEIGKIIACLPVLMYESYFRKLNLEIVSGNPHCRPADDGTYIPKDGSHWRQFYITSDDENNVCSKEDVNGGAKVPGGTTIYQATFTPEFTGMVEYFDVRRHNDQNPTVNLWEDQTAKVSEAEIHIDQNGYEQVSPGSIRTVQAPDDTGDYGWTCPAWDDRDSATYYRHRDDYHTGFQQLLTYNETTGEWEDTPEDIYEKIKTCVGHRAGYFHGETKLNGETCYYSEFRN